MSSPNSIFVCPDCSNNLSFNGKIGKCTECKKTYKNSDGIYNILPSDLSDNKIKEDEVYDLGELDNAWYNHRIWYYLIHLSSHIIRFEKEILPKIKGPKVLELACGNSWASLLIKRKNPKWEVFSSDVSFKSINIQAKQMCSIIETRPDYFIVCDAEKLPFHNNYFDTVFVIASLHHFSKIDKALSEAKRVLKPGGSLIAVDGMMPKIAQVVLGDYESERTKNYGILERKITYSDWISCLKKAKIPTGSLRINYDPSYLHTYATNNDEEKLIRKSWIFNAAKEIIYGGVLLRLSQNTIKLLRLVHIFPAGIIIDYRKQKN